MNSTGDEKASTEAIEEKKETSIARHPRWTIQETFVLIQGKKVVENQGRRRRKSPVKDGMTRGEPKWDAVSSYCKMHGVNREPVQCRKRLSNLLTDFKKIKTWESEVKEGREPYWIMRSDLRRERKLPGFFDRGVFDVLNGQDLNVVVATPLAIVKVTEDVKEEEDDEEEEEKEAVFDSGRHPEPDDGIFSDFEQSEKEDVEGSLSPLPFSDMAKEKPTSSNPRTGSMPKDGRKRRRLSFEGYEDTAVDRLTKVLEENGKMMNTLVEAQNLNSQLSRDQQRDSTNILISALDKITDAIVQIADKLNNQISQ